MTALSDLLNDAKADNSVDNLIAAAEKRGTTINGTARATVYKALNGDHAKRPREATLSMFAEIFQLDVREVRAAAGRAPGELGEWAPPAESAQLAQPVRDALDLLIKAIVNAEGGAGLAPASAPAEPSDSDAGGAAVIDIQAPPRQMGKAARKSTTRKPSTRSREQPPD